MWIHFTTQKESQNIIFIISCFVFACLRTDRRKLHLKLREFYDRRLLEH